MTPAERRRAWAIAAVIGALHVLGGVLLLSAGGAVGFGAGVTAYTLGMRHAFDADHIAAIDGTTRKLMADGRRPLSVGLWFSLGHCTVVLALGALVVAGVRGLAGAVRDDGSGLHAATGVVGSAVSGSFLVLIGLLNLAVLAGILRTVGRVRRGESDAATLAGQAAAGGVLA